MDKSVFRHLTSFEQGSVSRLKLYNAAKNNVEFIQRFKLEKTLQVHSGCVNSVCWNESGSALLSGSDDRHLVITDPYTSKVRYKVLSGHHANIFCAKFLPHCNDKRIVSCSGDGMITYTDLDANDVGGGYNYHSFDCHVGTVYQVVVVPGDRNSLLSCGEDGTVRWFDLRVKDRCVKPNCTEDVLINCRRAVTSLALNPVSPWQLAVGCADGNVVMYDRRKLATRATGGSFTKNVRGMIGRFSAPSVQDRNLRITSLTYSHDAEEVLVSYSTDQIYLFNVKDGGKSKTLSVESKAETPNEKDDTDESTGTKPPVKRLRLRGDWSDTGPNAVPERERGQAPVGSTAQNVMQRMSDMLTRWLEDAANQIDPASDQSQNSNAVASDESQEANAVAPVQIQDTSAAAIDPSQDASGETSENKYSMNQTSSEHVQSENQTLTAQPQATNATSSHESKEEKNLPNNSSQNETSDELSNDTINSENEKTFAYNLIQPADPKDKSNDEKPNICDQRNDSVASTSTARPEMNENNPEIITNESHESVLARDVRASVESGSVTNSELERVKQIDFSAIDVNSPSNTTNEQVESQSEEKEQVTETKQAKHIRESSSHNQPKNKANENQSTSKTTKEAKTEESEMRSLSQMVDSLKEKSMEPTVSLKYYSHGASNSQITFSFPQIPSTSQASTSGEHEQPSQPSTSQQSDSSANEAVLDQPAIQSELNQGQASRQTVDASSSRGQLKGPKPGTSGIQSSAVSTQQTQPNEADDTDSDDDVTPVTRTGAGGSSRPSVMRSIEQNLAARRLQRVFRRRQEQSAQREEEDMNLPRPAVKQCYSGHRNARTMIKQANFWGSDHVMSGSDCGHVFIWDRHSARLVMMLEADGHVVNCVQPHPYDPVLATSGIDYDIKLWSPSSPESCFDRARAEEIMGRNKIMLEETKDTLTVPATFMLRMLASFNRLRAARGEISSEEDS